MKTIDKLPQTYGEVIAIAVDIQNDFCEGGALAVQGGAKAASQAAEINQWVADKGGLIVATGDWHPADTTHFADYGGPWPAHCVANTSGAAFHPDLNLPGSAAVAYKGQSKIDDGYSGAEALLQPGSVLADIVQDLPDQQRTLQKALERTIRINAGMGQRTLGLLYGIAGDWCVPATGNDLVKLVGPDFDLAYISEATASIDQSVAEQKQAALEQAGMFATTIADLKSNVIIDKSRLER